MLAVSLHAAVNFIFYHAFISILVGIFVGRAWQVYKGPQRLTVLALPAISMEMRNCWRAWRWWSRACPYCCTKLRAC